MDRADLGLGPLWATDGLNTTEPSLSKKKLGIETGETADSAVQNWFQNAVYQGFRYLFESALEAATGSATVSVDASDKTYTRSTGSWIDDGYGVDQWVTWTGFSASGGVNNQELKVTAITDTVLTFGAASGLVDEAGVAATARGHISLGSPVTIVPSGGATALRVDGNVFFEDELTVTDDTAINGNLSVKNVTAEHGNLDLDPFTTSGQADDAAFPAIGIVVEATSTGAVTITGFVAASPTKRLVAILNGNAADGMTLKHQHAGSSANNRLKLPGGVDLVIPFNGSVWLYYNATRWVVLGSAP